MSSITSTDYSSNIPSEEGTLYKIREGVFGATFSKNNELLYLRMELLTKENTECWTKFKRASDSIANNRSRGVMSTLVFWAGTPDQPNYDEMKEGTGFTEKEYTEFMEKATILKNKRGREIANHIALTCNVYFMSTFFDPEKVQYIVYITRNRNFSIIEAAKALTKLNINNFIKAFGDILITMGSDFSKEDSFHNRGISRNPYWVFEEKYAGLSMLLHGFSGIFARSYFPSKKLMEVKPTGSMQAILLKTLQTGEGYLIDQSGKKKDLTEVEALPTDDEGGYDYIKISALTRIYQESMSNMKTSQGNGIS